MEIIISRYTPKINISLTESITGDNITKNMVEFIIFRKHTKFYEYNITYIRE